MGYEKPAVKNIMFMNHPRAVGCPGGGGPSGSAGEDAMKRCHEARFC
jgi:hypothetical protein